MNAYQYWKLWNFQLFKFFIGCLYCTCMWSNIFTKNEQLQRYQDFKGLNQLIFSIKSSSILAYEYFVIE